MLYKLLTLGIALGITVNDGTFRQLEIVSVASFWHLATSPPGPPTSISSSSTSQPTPSLFIGQLLPCFLLSLLFNSASLSLILIFLNLHILQNGEHPCPADPLGGYRCLPSELDQTIDEI